jgi:hypothetical protein
VERFPVNLPDGNQVFGKLADRKPFHQRFRDFVYHPE